MEFEKIKQKYEKIIKETNKALAKNKLIIKQVEKDMGDIMKKAEKNIKELSFLL